MSIEIRELIIRALLTDSGDGDDGSINKENIIAEAVEQAMEIIEKEEER